MKNETPQKTFFSFLSIPIVALVFVLVILIVASLFISQERKEIQQQIESSRLNSLLNLEIADSVPERERGLSGRTALPEDSGLFFIFDNEDFHGIWMKEMLFPIDIIWMDSLLSVVHTEENISPDSFPEIFYPEQKALYVLEANAGFIEKHQIKLGDSF